MWPSLFTATRCHGNPYAALCFFGLHGHAQQHGQAGARADHLHDGDLFPVQPLGREAGPHVVAQAQGRKLLRGEVLLAVSADGHFAVLAEHALRGVVRAGPAPVVFGAAEHGAVARHLGAPIPEVREGARLDVSREAVVGLQVLVQAEELVQVPCFRFLLMLSPDVTQGLPPANCSRGVGVGHARMDAGAAEADQGFHSIVRRRVCQSLQGRAISGAAGHGRLAAARDGDGFVVDAPDRVLGDGLGHALRHGLQLCQVRRLYVLVQLLRERSGGLESDDELTN